MYRLIDVSLDPFPTGGAATAMEALAMGVPVISLIYNKDRAGSYFVASSAKVLGIDQYTIATTKEQYIDLAVGFYERKWSIDRTWLAKETRKKLHSRRFTRNFEENLLQIWKTRCGG